MLILKMPKVVSIYIQKKVFERQLLIK